MPEETEPIEVWSNSLIWQARGGGWGAGECCPQVTQVTAAESTLSLYFLNSDSSFHLGFPDLPQMLRCLKGQKIYNIFLRLISSYSHFFFPKRNLMGIGIKTHIPFSILNKWMALVFPFAFIRLPLCSLCLRPSITYGQQFVLLSSTMGSVIAWTPLLSRNKHRAHLLGHLGVPL